MAKLIYVINTSLDGYVEDKDGNFAWTAPEKGVFKAITEEVRPIGTYLYGRRMYEVMAFWETAHTLPGQPDFTPGLEGLEQGFAEMWRAAEKIVYSRTLAAVASAKTRIEKAFDPEAVRRLKEGLDRDLTVGGPELAGQMLAAGLVDEIQLFVYPVVLGGGKKALPENTRLNLGLLAERRFPNGVVHLRYRVGPR